MEQEEREIDLVELMWDFFMHWKVVLVIMILCAVLSSVILYYRDTNTYKEQKALKKVSIEELSEELTETEIEEVNSAVSTYNSWFFNKVYLQESPFNTMDTSSLNEVRQDWLIRSTSDNISPTSLAKLYLSLIKSSEATEYFATNFGMPVDSRYLADMIYVEYEQESNDATDTVFTVNVILLQGMDPGQVASAMENYIVNMAPSQVDISAEFDMELLSTVQMIAIDSPVSANMNTRKNNNLTLRSTLDETIEGFTDDQKVVYEISSGDVYLGEEEENLEVSKPTRFSIKNIAIGCAAGIFLCAAFMFFGVFISKKITYASDVSSGGIYVIEEVHRRSITGLFKRFVSDRNIYRQHYKQKQNNLKTSINNVSAQVNGLAGKEGISEVRLMSLSSQFFVDGNANRYLNELKKTWKNSNISLVVEQEGDITNQVMSMPQNCGILILTLVGDTTFKDLREVSESAALMNLPIFGAVVLDI